MDGEALRKIAADLREAKRYVRLNPDESRKQTGSCIDTMHGVSLDVGKRERQIVDRLAWNLAVGLRHIQVMPDLLRNYLEAAAFELEAIAGPIEVPEVAESVS